MLRSITLFAITLCTITLLLFGCGPGVGPDPDPDQDTGTVVAPDSAAPDSAAPVGACDEALAWRASGGFWCAPSDGVIVPVRVVDDCRWCYLVRCDEYDRPAYGRVECRGLP